MHTNVLNKTIIKISADIIDQRVCKISFCNKLTNKPNLTVVLKCVELNNSLSFKIKIQKELVYSTKVISEHHVHTFQATQGIFYYAGLNILKHIENREQVDLNGKRKCFIKA